MASKRAIREADLVSYAAGDDDQLDDETFWLIERERKREGSPIWKWFQDFDAKCRDPFNVNWLAVALPGMAADRVEEHQDSDVRTSQPTKSSPVRLLDPASSDKLSDGTYDTQVRDDNKRGLPERQTRWWIRLFQAVQQGWLISSIEAEAAKAVESGRFAEVNAKIEQGVEWARRCGRLHTFLRRLIDRANEAIVLRRYQAALLTLAPVIASHPRVEASRMDDALFGVALKVMGRAYKGRGELDLALQFWNDSLNVSEHVYGRESQYYANELIDLGRLHEGCGKPSHARQCYQDAADILARITGGEWHPWFVYARDAAQRLQAAEPQQSGKGIPKSSSHEDDVQDDVQDIVSGTESQERQDIPRVTVPNRGGLKGILAFFAAIWGLRYLRRRRETLLRRSDYAGALRLTEAACSAAGYAPGLLPKEMATLGWLRAAMGQHHEALAHLEQAVSLEREFLWSNTARKTDSLVQCLQALAAVKAQQGDAQGATICVEEIRSLREGRRVKGFESYENLATDLNTRGIVHFYNGEFDAAASCLTEAIGLAQERLGEHHPLVGAFYTTQSNIEQARGNKVGAEECATKGREILLAHLGAHHRAFLGHGGILAIPYRVGREHHFAAMVTAAAA
jgi:tetratricopeptide (TPR) repeat protein